MEQNRQTYSRRGECFGGLNFTVAKTYSGRRGQEAHPLQRVVRTTHWSAGFGDVRCCAPDKQHVYQTRRQSVESHDELYRRTRWTRALHVMRVSLNSSYAYRTLTRLTGTGHNYGGKKQEVKRLVETLALGPVSKSTQ